MNNYNTTVLTSRVILWLSLTFLWPACESWWSHRKLWCRRLNCNLQRKRMNLRLTELTHRHNGSIISMTAHWLSHGSVNKDTGQMFIVNTYYIQHISFKLKSSKKSVTWGDFLQLVVKHQLCFALVSYHKFVSHSYSEAGADIQLCSFHRSTPLLLP